MVLSKNLKVFSHLFFVFLLTVPAFSQNSTVTVSDLPYNTYSYFDPNPVPVLVSNPKIYPYHKFDGYSHKSDKKNWKTITLENQYIKVVILPDVGGKVWAGIEKSTGGEFLYANDAIKFRNIAMRGPWTSGGIEFNFGIIGHSPSTASSVDYAVRENADGSASCIVGNYDLPSRTNWQVTITLPKDKAYFETNATWHNSSPLSQSYYNWMTAAAAATEDLEFVFPGNQYLTHSGKPLAWPVDEEGRELNFYKNNNFGPSKSYHVVGSQEDYFGGYYHNSNFGFGHWSPYDEMPGAKLWIWALSRAGGIWEDLLTDEKGQYIEYQAGRLFNQYSPGGDDNPIRNVPMAPYTSDRWKELWFPFKQIGGMVDASPYGVMNVEREGSDLYVGINALQYINDTLKIYDDNGNIRTKRVMLRPMEVYNLNIEFLTEGAINIELVNSGLSYSSRRAFKKVLKPFDAKPEENTSKQELLYAQADDAMAFREYEKAEKLYNEIISGEGYRTGAYLGTSELKYRQGQYLAALEFAEKVMMTNIYHPKANFMAGLAYHELGNPLNALEAFGWAARSLEFRTSSYIRMAMIALAQNDNTNALRYAQYALDYDRYNVKAAGLMAVAYRRLRMHEKHKETIEFITDIAPIDHFSRYERGFFEDKKYFERFKKDINNEFPEETLLELALDYKIIGEEGPSDNLLTMVGANPKALLLKAWSLKNINEVKAVTLIKHATGQPVDFVFPFRREMITVLEWANQKVDHWKLKYYLALIYVGAGRREDGIRLFKSCGDMPDYHVFYMTRAALDTAQGEEALADFEKAVELQPDSWRARTALYEFHNANGNKKEAFNVISKAREDFRGNMSILFHYASSLLDNGRPEECVNTLNSLDILPFEGYRGSRGIYEEAHVLVALDQMGMGKYRQAASTLEKALLWPETLGVGKPYDVDQRKIEYLLANCYKKLGQVEKMDEVLTSIEEYTNRSYHRNSANNLIGLLTLKLQNKETGPLEELLASSENSLSKQVVDSFREGKITMEAIREGSREFAIFERLLKM